MVVAAVPAEAQVVVLLAALVVVVADDPGMKGRQLTDLAWLSSLLLFLLVELKTKEQTQTMTNALMGSV